MEVQFIYKIFTSWGNTAWGVCSMLLAIKRHDDDNTEHFPHPFRSLHVLFCHFLLVPPNTVTPDLFSIPRVSPFERASCAQNHKACNRSCSVSFTQHMLLRSTWMKCYGGLWSASFYCCVVYFYKAKIQFCFHSSADGDLGFFMFGAIMNKAAMTILV